MRVTFIDIDGKHNRTDKGLNYIISVLLDVCPKVGERYVIFGVDYRVEKNEHTVTIKNVGRDNELLVVELINCFLKRIELIGKEAEQ